jgi:hypothetical protein
MRGEHRPTRPTSSAAAPDAGGQLRVCVNVPGLNRAASQDAFWPSRAGWGRGVAVDYIRMPFGQLNAGATYRRFARLALASQEVLDPREPLELQEPLGPREPLEPQEPPGS